MCRKAKLNKDLIKAARNGDLSSIKVSLSFIFWGYGILQV